MIPSREEMEQALVQRCGEKLKKCFSDACVAICGLGGLGSNIAYALARAGVGKLILIDFDRVDVSNLHRQQYKAGQVGMWKTEALYENLKEIAPYTELVADRERITERNAGRLLEGADIICEAFDDAEEKAMLVNFVLERLPGIYVVAASGMAGFESINSIRTRKITEYFYLCGDGTSEVKDGSGLAAPRVMACAAHQAQTVLRILAGKEVSVKKEGKNDDK